MADLDVEKLLFRLVPGFRARPQNVFFRRYDAEVGDFASEIQLAVFDSEEHGHLTLYVGGLVTKVKGEKWSLYETFDRVAERTHIQAWSNFCRGFWTNKIPTEPGVYPTRDVSGYRCKDHTFVKIDGHVIDTDSGHVVSPARSNWRGAFWNCPYPPLPGAM